MGRDPEQRGALRRTAELAFSVLGSLSETSILVFDTELRCVLAGRIHLAHGYTQRRLEGRAVTPRPSIGVAVLDAELDVDGVLRRADQAMYAVKRLHS